MIQAIVAAALHAIVLSIGLSAVLFGIVWLLVRTLSVRASVRHALWTIALVATAAMPLTGLGVSALRAVTKPPATRMSGHAPSLGGDISKTPTHETLTLHASSPDARDLALHPARWIFPLPALTNTIALAAVAGWVVGALIGLGGLLFGILRVRGLKKRSSPLEGTLADELPWLTENARSEREIYLRLSYETETPVAIGFRRPVILIPTELVGENGLGSIEPLVIHEYAHLQRYDDWTNLAQRTIERLFWFNPIVWLLGARIALEREIASDEAVVERTGHAHEYAKSLWQLAREMRMPEHSVVAPGALLTRRQITIRIEALLAGRTPIPALTPIAALAVGFAAVGCVFAVATSAPALEVPASPSVSAAPSLAHVTAPRAILFIKREHRIDPPKPPAVPTDFGDSIAMAVNRSVNVALGATTEALAHTGLSQHDIPEDAPPATLAKFLVNCIGCDFSGRDLHGADLRGLTLLGVNLAGANMREVRLDGAKFSGVNLQGVDLANASLGNASFIGTNFSHANFHRANLVGANVSGSSLRDANFSNADLSLANFTGASIRGANFHGAKIDGAVFDDGAQTGEMGSTGN